MKNSTVLLSEDLKSKISLAIQQDIQTNKELELQYKIIYDDDRRIYKIKVVGQPNFYVLKVRGIKVVKQQDHDLADLTKEYNLLEAAWKSAKGMTTGFSMSKPLQLWLEEKAMLMSGCAGENFNDFFNKNIFRWTFSINELSRGIHCCGTWLGNYHFLASENSPLDQQFSNRQSNLKRMLDFLAGKQRHKLSNLQLEKISQKFSDLTSTESEGPIAQVHGNFAYRNVLYNKQQTNLVDFEDAHYEHVAFDIGQFIAEIQFKSQFPWLRHRTEHLIDRFYTGYSSKCIIQPSITKAYIGYHLVVHLYEHCSRKTPSGFSKYILGYRIRFLSKLIEKWLA
ncbi:MAG: phosphotransferase [Kangiellaceae bacterium]|nr:phosphotransferase [Kangiellaceae bacterium]